MNNIFKESRSHLKFAEYFKKVFKSETCNMVASFEKIVSKVNLNNTCFRNYLFQNLIFLIIALYIMHDSIYFENYQS